MSNLLKVAMIDIILSLHRQGLSQRRIASELGINRETVARYLRQAEARAKTSQCAPRLDRQRGGQNQPMRPPARRACDAARTQLSLRSGRPETLVTEATVAPASASPGGR